MSTLTLPAPAKLNLFLHITGRRSDGYHLLQTHFQLLDHGDTLHFTPMPGTDITFSCSDPALESSDNLVMQAARLLRQTTNTARGIHIRLDKTLPCGAGLGGGSSDAATTLLALDHLWGTHLGLDRLAQLGDGLGADVPVFVQGDTAWAEGTGELLTPLPVPPRWYVVLTPPCHVVTAEIFRHPELTRDTPITTIAPFPKTGSRNDCQAVACSLYPEIGKTLIWLDQYSQASMTGTGSSVFAAFDSKAEADRILALKPDDTEGFVACGLNRSPVHKLLNIL